LSSLFWLGPRKKAYNCKKMLRLKKSILSIASLNKIGTITSPIYGKINKEVSK